MSVYLVCAYNFLIISKEIVVSYYVAITFTREHSIIEHTNASLTYLLKTLAQ